MRRWPGKSRRNLRFCKGEQRPAPAVKGSSYGCSGGHTTGSFPKAGCYHPEERRDVSHAVFRRCEGDLSGGVYQNDGKAPCAGMAAPLTGGHSFRVASECNWEGHNKETKAPPRVFLAVPFAACWFPLSGGWQQPYFPKRSCPACSKSAAVRRALADNRKNLSQ